MSERTNFNSQGVKLDEWDDVARTYTDFRTTPANVRSYTQAENLAADARAALALAGSNEVDLRTKANNALDANAAFLANPSPTQLQKDQQLVRLTKECSGIIRLLLRALSTVDGT